MRVESGATVQSYVVLPDGIAPVSDFTAALLVGSGSPVIPAGPAAVSGVRQSTAPRLDRPGWPELVPTPVRPQRDQPICFSTTPGDPPGDAPWPVRTSLPAGVSTGGEQPVFIRSGNAAGVVDKVVARRGSGAVVRATTPSGGDGALNLVTDSGQRFAIPTPEAATRLRYDPAKARSEPAPFVRLLPVGPALDPDRTAQEFAGR